MHIEPDADTPRRPQRRPQRRPSAERRRQIARRRGIALLIAVLVVILLLWRVAACACGGGGGGSAQTFAPVPPAPLPSLQGDGVKVGTFLGNYSRRFYGLGPVPTHLGVIWKVRLGEGWTSGKTAADKPGKWAGSGWTGQPNIVVDGGKTYVLASGYDHNLRKIDAATGKVVWKYQFDDIIKSSPSVFLNPHPTSADDKYIVCAGSRRGYPLSLSDPNVASYRAVTFGSGKELWRLPVPQTKSYSRDTDGSGFFLDGRQYIGVESGWFYALNPLETIGWRGHRRPKIEAQQLLLGDSRADSHHGNLCLEASPTALGDKVYITSGAGHVYGMRRSDLGIVWDYFTGSDIDGTPVPTQRGKLLVTVEKQYIKGHGGVLCLDPTKPPAKATKWFFPTGDRNLSEWKGGLIGSVAINDEYNPGGKYPALAAFTAIDGYLHVISQDTTDGTAVGFDGKTKFPTPVEVTRIWDFGGVSTPLFVGDWIISAAYDNRVRLLHVKYTPAERTTPGALQAASGAMKYFTVSVTQTDEIYLGQNIESTPTLWNGRVYIGCRDGYLYCLGDKKG